MWSFCLHCFIRLHLLNNISVPNKNITMSELQFLEDTMVASPLLLRNILRLFVKCKYLTVEAEENVLNQPNQHVKGTMVTIEIMKMCFGCHDGEAKDKMIKILAAVSEMGRAYIDARDLSMTLTGEEWTIE